MKTGNEHSETISREPGVDVEALLAAINEISENEVRFANAEDPNRVSVNGHDYHTWRELAEAFELDVHDVSVSEINR